MWNTPTPDQLASIPKLYETEHVPLEDKIIQCHFFLGNCDWYICEYDGDEIFWGFTILNGNLLNAEWGYISFSELQSIKIQCWLEIDFDCFWSPRPAREVKNIQKAHRWASDTISSANRGQ